jgi:hypothetical protein
MFCHYRNNIIDRSPAVKKIRPGSDLAPQLIASQYPATCRRARTFAINSLDPPKDARFNRISHSGSMNYEPKPMDRMYSMHDLLQLINSDGADELKLQVGNPPVVVLQGEHHTIEGPPITSENAQGFLQSIASTRQRRELHQHGTVQFIYRFRQFTDFVVCARLEDENVAIDIH